MGWFVRRRRGNNDLWEYVIAILDLYSQKKNSMTENKEKNKNCIDWILKTLLDVK